MNQNVPIWQGFNPLAQVPERMGPLREIASPVDVSSLIDANDFVREASKILSFPAYGIFRALGVRLNPADSKKYGGDRFDISRHRSIDKFFKCIIFYKDPPFKRTRSKRQHLYVQFFENPADSMFPGEDFDWGPLRPILFDNLKHGATDVIEWYEWRHILGGPFDEIPEAFEVPSNAYVCPYGEDQYVIRYKRRCPSNRVTNTKLDYFFIYGTGGRPLMSYDDAELVENLQFLNPEDQDQEDQDPEEKKNLALMYKTELERLANFTRIRWKNQMDELLLGFPHPDPHIPQPLPQAPRELNVVGAGVGVGEIPILDTDIDEQEDPDLPGFLTPIHEPSQDFQTLLDYSHRINVLRSQVSPQIVDEEKNVRIFRENALAHIRNLYKKQKLDAERALKSAASIEEIADLVHDFSFD